MRLAVLVLALPIVLGACSGGSDEPKAVATTPTLAPGAVPTTPAPTGDPVPEALSRFRCEADGAGTYVATGKLSNTSKAAVTFQVTVQVGPVDTPTQSAVTKQVPKVAAGSTVDFQVDAIPVVEGGSCHVQVVTTK